MLKRIFWIGIKAIIGLAITVTFCFGQVTPSRYYKGEYWDPHIYTMLEQTKYIITIDGGLEEQSRIVRVEELLNKAYTILYYSPSDAPLGEISLVYYRLKVIYIHDKVLDKTGYSGIIKSRRY